MHICWWYCINKNKTVATFKYYNNWERQHASQITVRKQYFKYYFWIFVIHSCSIETKYTSYSVQFHIDLQSTFLQVIMTYNFLSILLIKLLSCLNFSANNIRFSVNYVWTQLWSYFWLLGTDISVTTTVFGLKSLS